jgi:NAD(P)H-flavin reductase
MKEGAEESADREPAWWKAEIIHHERRMDDIAVIRLRTDREYPYIAGQYAAVETPYRPQSWRTYSMARAPSPDGELELHVRAVGAGWVSGPLVWRAGVGDLLRIGAATGEMVVDQSSERDLLLIAGGTGLAPLKAVVEDMARWNTSRRVHLFFGARREDELYDLPALDRLAARHRWLTVLPVVSDDQYYHGLKGLLPGVVAQQGPWDAHDALVCGPPAMVRATVNRLHELGVPPDRIRYDVYREVHPASAQVIDLRRSRASRTVGDRRRG